jgi:hypothetical protein
VAIFLFPTEERKNSSDLSFDSSEVSSDSSEEIFRSSVAIFDFLRRNLVSVHRLKNQMIHFSEGGGAGAGLYANRPPSSVNKH